jgi:hypothetical protein
MAIFNKVKVGLINIILTVLNYNKSCHIHNKYSGINRGVNKKEEIF